MRFKIGDVIRTDNRGGFTKLRLIEGGIEVLGSDNITWKIGHKLFNDPYRPEVYSRMSHWHLCESSIIDQVLNKYLDGEV